MNPHNNEAAAFYGAMRRLKEVRGLDKRPPPKDQQPDTLRRSEIDLEPAVFQPRFDEDLERGEQHVKALVAAIRAKPDGKQHLDRILVVAIGKRFVLVDGHQRLAAYDRAHVDVIPVEHFPGSLEEAHLESGRRNVKDKLPMTREAKQEVAWRAIALNEGVTEKRTMRQIAEATAVSERLLFQMAAARKQLRERHLKSGGLSWEGAKLKLKGEEPDRASDDWKRKAIVALAKKLAPILGPNPAVNAEIITAALELVSKRLPLRLVEVWTDHAVTVAKEAEEELEEYRRDVDGLSGGTEPEPF